MNGRGKGKSRRDDGWKRLNDMWEKSKSGDAIRAKEIMVYYHATGRQVFQGSVELKNVPGALAGVSGELARSGINLVATESWNMNSTGLAEWGFFAEADLDWKGLDEVEKTMARAPNVVGCAFREGKDGMVVDTLHYPLRLNTGEPAMVLSRNAFAEMIQNLLGVFGSGGRVVIHQLGVAGGKESCRNLLRTFGREGLELRFPEAVSLYAAMGWGKPELAEYTVRPFSGRLIMYDSFECTGPRKGAPQSEFIRGHLEGFGQTLVNRAVACKETKCLSAGDPYCELRYTEK